MRRRTMSHLVGVVRRDEHRGQVTADGGAGGRAQRPRHVHNQLEAACEQRTRGKRHYLLPVPQRNILRQGYGGCGMPRELGWLVRCRAEHTEASQLDPAHLGAAWPAAPRRVTRAASGAGWRAGWAAARAAAHSWPVRSCILFHHVMCEAMGEMGTCGTRARREAVRMPATKNGLDTQSGRERNHAAAVP